VFGFSKLAGWKLNNVDHIDPANFEKPNTRPLAPFCAKLASGNPLQSIDGSRRTASNAAGLLSALPSVSA
jgi:hypothetical protein